jgi:membrane-bound metal-dependent hydrolase YbcI (DUF457 family)
MFIGHFGAGMALKKLSPSTSLGTLLLAADLPDVIFPILMLAGIEEAKVSADTARLMPFDMSNYPWSHSLLMIFIAGSLLAGGFWLKNRNILETLAIILAALSHWLLDFISHRPDMPLWPGSAKFGLGLWDSLPGTLLVEIGIFALGILIFLKSSEAVNKAGKWGFWWFVIFLLPLYFGSLFGPPPPDMKAFGYVGIIGQFIFVGAGYWIDRNRRARG